MRQIVMNITIWNHKILPNRKRKRFIVHKRVEWILTIPERCIPSPYFLAISKWFHHVLPCVTPSTGKSLTSAFFNQWFLFIQVLSHNNVAGFKLYNSAIDATVSPFFTSCSITSPPRNSATSFLGCGHSLS